MNKPRRQSRKAGKTTYTEVTDQPRTIAEYTREAAALVESMKHGAGDGAYAMARRMIQECEVMLLERTLAPADAPKPPPVVKKQIERLCESWGGGLASMDPEDWAMMRFASLFGTGTDAANWILDRLNYHRATAQWLYTYNCHYRGIIDHMVNYIVGPDPVVSFKPILSNARGKNPLIERCKEKWSRRENRRGYSFPNVVREFVTRALKVGECGCRLLPRNLVNGDAGPANAEWRFMAPEYIVEPVGQKETNRSYTYGIETLADDVQTVLAYWYRKSPTSSEIVSIPADEVVFCKIGVDSDVKRGLPFLFTATKRIRDYDEWLCDRIILNKVRTAICLVIYSGSGSPGSNEARANRLQTGSVVSRRPDGNTQTVRTQTIRPGTIAYAGKDDKWEYLNPSTGAADAAEDGRAQLLAIAVACNLPEFVVSGDASNNNYASALVAESPGVLHLQAKQRFFSEPISDMVRMTMIAEGVATEEELRDIKIDITKPNIAVRDPTEFASETQMLRDMRLISRRSAQERHGLEPEVEDAEMESDQTEPIDAGAEPLNRPPAPKVRGKKAKRDDSINTGV